MFSISGPIPVEKVFVPNSMPTYTYVNRNSEGGIDFEQELKSALSISSFLVSLSGPSKTGKTILCERVLDNNLLLVRSSEIDSSEKLRKIVLARLNTPEKITITREGGFKLPVAEASGSITDEYSDVRETPWKKLATSGKVLVIDDFHYLDRPIQDDICRTLKHAIEENAKIIVITIYYRHDDAIRSNGELSGRIKRVDIPTWDKSQLSRIIETGFNTLGYQLEGRLIHKIAEESLGSPQLTQHICLELCKKKNSGSSVHSNTISPITELDIETACREVARSCTAKTEADKVLSAKERRKRTKYDLNGGGTGDIYKILLKVIASDPPTLELKYKDMVERSKAIRSQGNLGASLAAAAKRASEKSASSNMSSAKKCLDWDEETSTLHLPDPYFVFYLRWSDILK